MKKIICTVLLVFITTAFHAQTTLYLIGDSTMADKVNPQFNPETGWGQVLPEYITSTLKIENHAKNGRSSKSFIDEGRWKVVYEKLKEGDYVFIQFGHNDQKVKSTDRYTNPTTTYSTNLKYYIDQVRSKGAFPVLLTSIVRRNYNEYGNLVDTHGMYPVVVRLVALEKKVSLIDLQALTEELVNSFGQEGSKKLYLHYEKGENSYYPEGKHDDTHLSKFGAHKVAELVIQELKRQGILSAYIQ